MCEARTEQQQNSCVRQEQTGSKTHVYSSVAFDCENDGLPRVNVVLLPVVLLPLTVEMMDYQE